MSPQSGPEAGVLFDVPPAPPGGDGGGGPASSGSGRGARSGGPAGNGAAKTAKKGPKRGRRPAAELPIARVAVETPLPHLDRLFDYRVPEEMAEEAVPGCRVRVPFHGQALSGFLIERAESSDYTGTLAYLTGVVSAEPVLTPEIRGLARAVADRYAGTLSDVLRLAVPPRHARVEKEKAERERKARERAGRQDGAAEGGEPAESAGPALEEEAAAVPDGGAPAASSAAEAAGGPGPGAPDGAPSPAGDGTGAAEPAASGGGEDRASEAAGPEDGAPAVFSAAEVAEASGGAGPDGPDGAPSPAGEGAGAAEPAATGKQEDEDGEESGAPAIFSVGEAEACSPPPGSGEPPLPVPPGPWRDYPAGESFLRALHGGAAPRAVWTALPGPGWAEAIAVAAGTAAAAGRGTVVVVPDGRDVATVDAALLERLGEGRHVALTAELGPAERYRRWLAALRGEVPIVVGTRAAMFAPVHDLGLVVLWDDGDDVHTDPHAPYPNARTVLALRAHRAGAAALIGGFTRTTEGTRLVESGWAGVLAGDRATVRRLAPRIRAAGDDHELSRDEAARSARLPSVALRIAREAAARGPVLVQVPRRGYLGSLACALCRAPSRCEACQGPLALRSAHAMPYCRWCGRIAGDWQCGDCGHRRLRAGVVGDRRTAEELGRAFPSLPVRTSGRDEVLASVSKKPALVVATPGAEPVAEGGYAAALLLDGWALLSRADLRAAEEALRRWFTASALVRPAEEGGQVVVVADAREPAVQSLIRWDPAGFAERELAERRELGFPPAVTMASVTGEAAHVRELLDALALPPSAELLGPVPVEGPEAAAPREGRGRTPSGPVERALLRVPHRDAYALTAALKAAAAGRSARKDDNLAQIRVDPLHVV
ncbi:primosomal protein N' [Nocardiopsis composta]|uniref:Probable replication restart protein PriA n=2 Tax=Nocardiopsis composta TaxID=157465 RepID=A0A7W8QSG0_9ACTN|nr:primosomal protein N' [Nocardiopsis composta]MBB5435752.1 primosomal protein N' (replication factor Y) [Nocardiopsis composta]